MKGPQRGPPKSLVSASWGTPKEPTEGPPKGPPEGPPKEPLEGPPECLSEGPLVGACMILIAAVYSIEGFSLLLLFVWGPLFEGPPFL